MAINFASNGADDDHNVENNAPARHAQHHLQDSAELQGGLLAAAGENVLAVQSYLPEIEELNRQTVLNDKIRSNSGLPSFIRSLKRCETTLQDIVSELSATKLPEDKLKIAGRKIEACAIDIGHSSVHWDVLKRCHSLVAVNQAFQGSARESRKKEIAKLTLSTREKQVFHRTIKEQAKVEVHVVEGGAEWIDIRTLQPDRLARQMTDSGWGWGDHELGDRVDEQDWEDVQLVKQIKRVVAAARLNRHEYAIPRVRVVLPNIGRDNHDINVLLRQVTSLDPSMPVVIEDRDSDFLQSPAPVVEVAIPNLVGNEFDGLTETLNMDHTILIDLISDLTHCRLEPQPWQAETTKSQIEEEAENNGLMARVLYPILQGRSLVCTKEAAEHFHTVLSTVGTATEKERGRLLVPIAANAKALSPDAIRCRFQELSIYPLPSTVQVPVTILDEDWTQQGIENTVGQGRLPNMALQVARNGGFKSSKLSIFMYGWASGNVTVTSNKEIKGQMKTLIEANREHDDERGPHIWRLDVTRNLLAKSATPPDDFLHDSSS